MLRTLGKCKYICLSVFKMCPDRWEYCRTGIFRKRAIFGIWLIWIFGKVSFSEFTDVELLPILMKVNSAERLKYRFSVQATNFCSMCVYKIALSLNQRKHVMVSLRKGTWQVCQAVATAFTARQTTNQ